MFETAELGRKLKKSDFEAMEPPLRIELLELQQALRKAKFPVIVVFAGVDGAGKGETVNKLNEWMDPRWMLTRAWSSPSDEEAERPEFWRYWRDLPAKGQIGLYLRTWYSRPVVEHAHGRLDDAAFEAELGRIQAFEKTLADDGALILKFWMHLGRGQQRKRLKALEADPLLSWRVTPTDWKHYEMYDRFLNAGERVIIRTSTGAAPWFIVEGADARYRFASVATQIRDAIRARLNAGDSRPAASGAPVPSGLTVVGPEDTVDNPSQIPLPTILSSLDMTQKLDKKAYKAELKAQQSRLNELQRAARAKGLSSLLVFEGADAAGKGGAIRRVTGALDARDFEVMPIAAPTDEERAQHYLWRFWRRLGRAGRVTIFDRSWYGRVLVERVEGFATEAEWMRAYAEINHFEQELVERGIVLMKYWVHITEDEQLRRFEARAATPWKQWKLTDEDWRNREKWSEYERAVDDMVERTSTSTTPWTLVEGNDKPFARVKVIRSFCDQLEAALSR